MKRHLCPLLLTVLAAGVQWTARGQRIADANAGQSRLLLTDGQQAAVSAFRLAHPDFQPANCATLRLSASQCMDEGADWRRIVKEQNATPQYQFAVWGDFRRRGVNDVVIPFFRKHAVNSWNWRQWDIVVLEAMPSGRYTPLVAVTGTWGTCFDGILYHPVRKQVEFWCKSMGGSIKWTGAEYVGHLGTGD